MVDLLAIANQLDDELVTIDTRIGELTDRRQRVARALDALRLIDTAPEPEPAAPPASDPVEKERTRSVADITAPRKTSSARKVAAKVPVREVTKASARGSVDYAAVASVMRTALEAGVSVRPAVAAHFGVPATTAVNWVHKVHKLGLLEPAKPFTSEPITRMPVDHQRVRDEQAGPPTGKVQGLTGGKPGKPPAERPVAPVRPLFTPDQARELIEASR